jgi:hypothetical protein
MNRCLVGIMIVLTVLTSVTITKGDSSRSLNSDGDGDGDIAGNYADFQAAISAPNAYSGTVGAISKIASVTPTAATNTNPDDKTSYSITYNGLNDWVFQASFSSADVAKAVKPTGDTPLIATFLESLFASHFSTDALSNVISLLGTDMTDELALAWSGLERMGFNKTCGWGIWLGVYVSSTGGQCGTFCQVIKPLPSPL